MYIYNSLKQQKELLEPLESNKIKMYLCGVTVYDYCHIGHARTAVVFDILYRYLKVVGFEVTYVRNITDIDDKIIKRAAENQEKCSDLTDRFIKAMHEDYGLLGILPPTYEPRATESIESIFKIISKLIDKNCAYLAGNGDVYYDTTKLKDYGLLAQQSLDSLQAGIRIDVKSEKKHALDFVLWKKAKEGEPSWPSPWGEGRPGWHIECSAMVMQHLGETIDIHGGGNDLKFPHHENERAQSEACTNKKFVRNWLHIGFVNINEEKMSKSLNNFFTVREVLAKYDAETVRYFLISSHYRGPINYSSNNLQNARRSLETLYLALRGLDLKNENLQTSEYSNSFLAAMGDDLNTPKAIAVLFAMAHDINSKKENNELNKASIIANEMLYLANILGICRQIPEHFLQNKAFAVNSKHINNLLAERDRARKEKDFAKADAIREQLEKMHILIEDTATSTSWRFKS